MCELNRTKTFVSADIVNKMSAANGIICLLFCFYLLKTDQKSLVGLNTQ